MLVRVGIERKAVTKLVTAHGKAEATHRQRRLCAALLRRAALYFNSADELDAFREEVREKRWSEIGLLWGELEINMRNSRWRLRNGEQLDVLLTAPRSRPSRAKASSRPRRVPVDQAVDWLDAPQARDIAAGTARDQVWEEYIKPLADHFRSVTIYAPSPQAKGAIDWLKERFAACARQVDVTVAPGAATGDTAHLRFTGGSQTGALLTVAPGLDGLAAEALPQALAVRYLCDSAAPSQREEIRNLREREER